MSACLLLRRSRLLKDIQTNCSRYIAQRRNPPSCYLSLVSSPIVSSRLVSSHAVSSRLISSHVVSSPLFSSLLLSTLFHSVPLTSVHSLSPLIVCLLSSLHRYPLTPILVLLTRSCITLAAVYVIRPTYDNMGLGCSRRPLTNSDATTILIDALVCP